MLLAHIVPGYFAASFSRSHWPSTWSQSQKYVLWGTAIASTVLPDTDVVYNIIARGFANHSVLWTHSLFPYLGLGLVWYQLHTARRWPFLRMLIAFMAIGGFSHLLLDVIAHSTPLFYPLSMIMVGWPPQQVVDGGFWGYVTHPIILLEPLLLGVALLHWFQQRA